MANFTEKDLEKLAKLSRIACSDEEKKKLHRTLQSILTYIEQLKEIDTEGVTPCSHVMETMANVMRGDEVGELLPREVFLGNAPAHTGGMVRVPPVLKPIE
jgi:aspartyl-tRNA(Asn)/glutamyl-tRNA(Gln) amidotransferase subunit C